MLLRANAIQIPLTDNSVHCVVTSPPYWGLRKYQGDQETAWPDGTRCGYGLEPTIKEYVEHSLVVLREVRSVLRDDGVCWWNMADSYAHGTPGGGSVFDNGRTDGRESYEGDKVRGRSKSATLSPGLKPLDLCLIPERMVLAAQADGWYVRSIPIWNKLNPMPESVNGWRWEQHRVRVSSGERGAEAYRIGANGDKPQQDHNGRDFKPAAYFADCPGCEKCNPNDGLVLRKGSWRPTDAYEHILMLTKTADYFGDAEAVKENGVYAAGEQRGPGEHKSIASGSRTTAGLHDKTWTGNGTRNLRNVWTFPTQPYPEAHFATFPERLPEICIKASTSERGCCPKCGANWARVIEPSPDYAKKLASANDRGDWYNRTGTTEKLEDGTKQGKLEGGVRADYRTLGWRPSCSCNEIACLKCGMVIELKYGKGQALQQELEGSKVRMVRQEVRGLSSSHKEEELLRQDVPREMVSQEPEDNNWPVSDHKRLRDAAQTGSPGSEQGRVCNGAPDSYGGHSWPLFDGARSGSPFEREKVGQQARESGTDGGERSQQAPEEVQKDRAETLPALQSNDLPLGTCQACGGKLIARTPEPVPALILDCFGGSGTTARVALRLNRRAVSIDLAYHGLAKKRTKELQPVLAVTCGSGLSDNQFPNVRELVRKMS